LVKALIFDVDGTLADTEDAHRKAFNNAFQEFGYSWNWDQTLYKALLKVTGGKHRIRHFLETAGPDLLQDPGIDEIIADLHKKKTEFYISMLEGGAVPLRPGIEALIAECRAKEFRIAIATTTTPVNVEALLSVNLSKESLSWFEAIGDGGKVPVLKPAPDVYLWVLEQLQLEAKDCLALEDSRNGLLASIAAELPCLIVTNPYTEDQDFTGALQVLPSWEGLDLSELTRLHENA
jgi:HAD superfamily hydrolase (TIGR01509 family)